MSSQSTSTIMTSTAAAAGSEEPPANTAPVVSASTLSDRFFHDSTSASSSSVTPEQQQKKDGKGSLLRSYITRLPFDSFRFVFTMLLIVSVLALTVISNDLDGQLARRHVKNVHHKKGAPTTPTFSVGPIEYDPQREYSSSRGFAGAVVIGISIIFAGLMV